MRGRIRSVKPEVLKDEELWDLEVESGLPIFRAFEGLWMYSDREGRFEWRPRALKTDILPYWEGDFSRVLDALMTRGFVVRYASSGKEYGWVRTFKKHQAINNKEPLSVLPDPNEEGSTILGGCPRVTDACGSREPSGSVGHEGIGNGNGSGMGTEGSGKSAPAPRGLLPPTAPADVLLWQAWERVMCNGMPAGARPRTEVFEALAALEARGWAPDRFEAAVRLWVEQRRSGTGAKFEYFARDIAGLIDDAPRARSTAPASREEHQAEYDRQQAALPAEQRAPAHPAPEATF